MFSQKPKNPWQEAEAPQVQRAIAVLSASKARGADLISFFPRQRSSIEAFIGDLAQIEEAYRDDVRSYRMTRALTAVHLPALFEALDDIASQNGAAGPEADQALNLAFQLAAESRAKIKEAKLDGARITLATLQDGQAEDRGEEKEASGWLRQVAARTNYVARGAVDPVSSLVTSGYGKVTKDASRHLSGLTTYATTAASGLVEGTLSLVTSPVATHFNALRAAAWTAAGSMALESVLIAVIFPPALPLAVGAGILEGTAKYSDHLSAEKKKETERRAALRSARDEKSKEALGKILGRSPIVSLSSPHLYVTINTDEDTASGTVLSGQYIGQLLEDIDPFVIDSMIKHAPDDDTRTILTSWQKRTRAQA